MFKKILLYFLGITLLMSILVLGGCGGPTPSTEESEMDGLSIVTSFSILADVVENIVGERGKVEYLVPIGENPEDYELLPGEMRIASDADIIFINGMNVEGAMEGALRRSTGTSIVILTEGIEPIPLEGDDAPDPHAWLDAGLMKIYVENILHSLIEVDSDGDEIYRKNAEEYILSLEDLDSWIRDETSKIQENNRIIVVSENAYKYYGEAYGFQTEGIWELNSHEEGTPQQISRVVELVKGNNIPALFVETTVDQRYMETVSRETGVTIAGKVYTDALGPAGSGAETYIEMMKFNTELFVEGLKN